MPLNRTVKALKWTREIVSIRPWRLTHFKTSLLFNASDVFSNRMLNILMLLLTSYIWCNSIKWQNCLFSSLYLFRSCSSIHTGWQRQPSKGWWGSGFQRLHHSGNEWMKGGFHVCLFVCSRTHIYVVFLCPPLKQGTPALSQSSIAADLLKGTITRLATEDPSSPDKARGEQLAKGHVIYEGKSGHIVSYDSCKCLLLLCHIMFFLCVAHKCDHRF